MKKLLPIFLTLCLFITGCGKKTTELSVTLEPVTSLPPAESTPLIKRSTETIEFTVDFTSEDTRKMSNFTNGGLYYYDDLIYGRMCPSPGGKMQLSTVSLSNSSKNIKSGIPVCFEGNALGSYFCRNGEQLYYIREDNYTGDFAVARSGISGGYAEILYRGRNCDYLQIHNGRLYFTNEDNHLVSTDLNGNEYTVLLEKELYIPYFISNEWLLYQDDADNESLHVFNIESAFDIKLNDIPSYTPAISGNTLYYLGIPEGQINCRLCSIDLSDMILSLDEETGAAELDRECEIGDRDVYLFLTDGQYIYGANNTVAPISQWRSFSDGGYSGLSELFKYLDDGWNLSYLLNDTAEVESILLRKENSSSTYTIPRLAE